MVQVSKPLVIGAVSALAAAILFLALRSSGSKKVRVSRAPMRFVRTRQDADQRICAVVVRSIDHLLPYVNGRQGKRSESNAGDDVREVPNLHKEQLLSILETICAQMGQVVVRSHLQCLSLVHRCERSRTKHELQDPATVLT